MRTFVSHLRMYIFRGFLAMIPVALSLLVFQFFYRVLDKRISDLFDQYIGYRIPGLGILLFLVALYIIGFLASNVIGRRFFGFIERIVDRIPIIKTTYQAGKQLSSTLALPEQQVFKRVVLLEFFRPGVLTVGFVTGTLQDEKRNEKLLKVFVPTVPNPTSGFLVMVNESQVTDPKWTVEQGLKTVITGGIISPDEIG